MGPLAADGEQVLSGEVTTYRQKTGGRNKG